MSLPFRTRDTVAVETPACAAMSASRTRLTVDGGIEPFLPATPPSALDRAGRGVPDDVPLKVLEEQDHGDHREHRAGGENAEVCRLVVQQEAVEPDGEGL